MGGGGNPAPLKSCLVAPKIVLALKIVLLDTIKFNHNSEACYWHLRTYARLMRL